MGIHFPPIRSNNGLCGAFDVPGRELGVGSRSYGDAVLPLSVDNDQGDTGWRLIATGDPRGVNPLSAISFNGLVAKNVISQTGT